MNSTEENERAVHTRYAYYMAVQGCDHDTLDRMGVHKCPRCMQTTWGDEDVKGLPDGDPNLVRLGQTQAVMDSIEPRRADRAMELSRTMSKSGDLHGATWGELTRIWGVVHREDVEQAVRTLQCRWW